MNQERIIQGNLLHTLAARSLIRDLEEGSSFLHANSANPSTVSVRDEVIRLGTKYGYCVTFTFTAKGLFFSPCLFLPS